VKIKKINWLGRLFISPIALMLLLISFFLARLANIKIMFFGVDLVILIFIFSLIWIMFRQLEFEEEETEQEKKEREKRIDEFFERGNCFKNIEKMDYNKTYLKDLSWPLQIVAVKAWIEIGIIASTTLAFLYLYLI